MKKVFVKVLVLIGCYVGISGLANASTHNDSLSSYAQYKVLRAKFEHDRKQALFFPTKQNVSVYLKEKKVWDERDKAFIKVFRQELNKKVLDGKDKSFIEALNESHDI